MEEKRKIQKQRGLFMEIQVKSADRNLLLELSGELDHHGARALCGSWSWPLTPPCRKHW